MLVDIPMRELNALKSVLARFDEERNTFHVGPSLIMSRNMLLFIVSIKLND